ncbi:MAG: hypothetical protein ACE5HU_00125 [Acidobacteriota bacterium]
MRAREQDGPRRKRRPIAGIGRSGRGPEEKRLGAALLSGHHQDIPGGVPPEPGPAGAGEPTDTITIGGFTYRTSPALIAAGREIFRNHDFGSHLFWDFRRAIDYSTGITDAAEYSRRYGVKRDGEGYFVGLVGVKRNDGKVMYGHSCALCHANVGEDGAIVEGMANHDYDVGLYYEALRSTIRDVDQIYLGDAGLDVLGSQGAGRTDSTMDGFYAPMRIPHLFALRAFEHGLRANGDMPNLWIQCYRNLNGAYAVDSDIMEALMAFLLSIKAPPNPRHLGERERHGETIFRGQRCHRCHLPPYYTNGRVIDWKSIRTDPDRIHNGYPKGYKVPSLLRLDRYRFYLHDGSLTALGQLFDPARLEPTYQAPGIPPARRKPGVGVPGHRFGLRLSPSDRADLIAFLESL